MPRTRIRRRKIKPLQSPCKGCPFQPKDSYKQEIRCLRMETGRCMYLKRFKEELAKEPVNRRAIDPSEDY